MDAGNKNLTSSFLINGYNQVKLHKIAFSDKEEEVTLYIPGDFSGGATIYEIPSSYTDNGEIKKVKVPAVNFAKYFPNVKAHVIKIDIQGAEPHLVDGLLEIAERSGTLDILMEYAPILWIAAGFNPKSVLQRFTSNNFSLGIIEQNGTLKKVSLDKLLSITKKMETSGGFVDLRLSRRI
jgi:FkbM family methyltransferase